MQKLTVVFAIVLLALPGVAGAQSTSADLAGTVLDATRGVVPGAELSLVNESTGIVRITHSDSVGHYAFTQLAPGHPIASRPAWPVSRPPCCRAWCCAWGRSRRSTCR